MSESRSQRCSGASNEQVRVPPTPGQAEVPGDDGMEERRGQHVARGVSHGAHEGHVEQGEEGPGRPQNLLRMNSCVRVCDPRDRGAGTTEV